MAQSMVKQARQENLGRSTSFNLEHADAVILNPSSSRELAQRLALNSAWKIRCRVQDLVIFVRSGS